MRNEEKMGSIAELKLFRNFMMMLDPNCKIEYHYDKYARYWDVRVYSKGKWRYYQIKPGAPYVTKRAGVLNLSQQQNYINFMANPTIDGGEIDSKLDLLSFPIEGPPRFNKEIRESWLGNVYLLKPSVIKNASEDMFEIQDRNTKNARYIIPYEGNYKCIGQNLHLREENIEIYETLKNLTSSKYR